MWVVNSNVHLKYNIPHSKIFLSLSSIGWILLSLFPIGRDLHFSFRIQIAENTPTSCFTIRIMKALRQSPMRIHDVVGKSVIYYPHHEGA
jgi:hypothetical protein